MYIVLDFDGTLVKENSSRIFEQQLISCIQNTIIRWFLFLIFFSRLSHITNYMLALISKIINVYDLRRRIIIKFVARWIGVQRIRASIKLTVRKLNANETLCHLISSCQDRLLILSSSLDVIIHQFLKERNIQAKAVIASKLVIDNNCVSILYEIGLKEKEEILNKLSKHSKVIYITDDLKEYHILKSRITKNGCKVLMLSNFKWDSYNGEA